MKSTTKTILITLLIIAIVACLCVMFYYSGYRIGYTRSLVNQERGWPPHDYILTEQQNGEWKWEYNVGKDTATKKVYCEKNGI